jgi:hypothetical protein
MGYGRVVSPAQVSSTVSETYLDLDFDLAKYQVGCG